MIFNMILFSLVIAISYLVIFYFVLPVNIKKWQAIIHILITLVWAWILFVPIETMPLEYEVPFALFVELGFIIVTLYYFTEGDLLRNFFIFMITYSVTSMMGSIYLEIFNSDFVEVLMLPIVEKARLEDFVPYYIAQVVSVFLVRPIMLKIARYSDGYEFVYRYVVAALMFVYLIDYMVRKFTNAFDDQIMSFDVRAVVGVLSCCVLVYIVIWTKRKFMETQKKMLQEVTIITGEKYKEIVDNNQELKHFRHEINRHADAIKHVRSFVSYDEMGQYVASLGKVKQSFFEISFSGNLYLDAMVEKYYETLQKQGVVLETVLEPINIDDETAMELLCITEEMFLLILDNISNKKWCRYCVRVRNNMILCQMETEYNGYVEYCWYKFLDMVGDKMFVRQRLMKTRNIVNNRNGFYIYDHEKRKITLAAMIAQDM